MKFSLAVLGIALAMPTWAAEPGEPALLALNDGKGSSASGVGQVPESLKRKVKSSALIKKPVVVK